ncbi:MAG TPA: serine/threonine-protein kinase [Kofleriaceae bacterium]|jgi:serine/threonine protein kinase
MKVGPGTVIAGRFELRSHAAAGGMGSVFLAHDLKSARQVAIKLLLRDGAEDVVRFEREADLLATVQHPNVVEYIAHGESDGVYYLAQEWVDGLTVSAQMRTLGVTAPEAIALAIGVADALDAAHSAGVVHRDVKPSNIILAGNALSEPRLVDFGVARMAEAAGVLTRTGVMIGTPAYMSPEQCRGQTYIDAAADVWSLGCVLYECLTGRSPFTGATATASRAKVLLGEPSPLRQFCAEANDELVQLTSELLAKHPGDRPACGGDAAARLRALPAMHAGPRRKSQRLSTPHPAQGLKTPRVDAQALVQANSYVLVTPQGTNPSAVEEDDRRLGAIADRMGMKLDLLEDGTAVLTSRDAGKAGALAAARVAMQIRAEVWEDAAVTVFGRAYDDDVTDAIERGAALLEQSHMAMTFGGVVEDATPVIHVDDVIAELVADEIPIERGPDGPAIKGDVKRMTRT